MKTQNLLIIVLVLCLSVWVALCRADVVDSTKAMKEEAEDATAPTIESAVDASAPTADAPGPVGEKSDESFVHWAYDKISHPFGKKSDHDDDKDDKDNKNN
ncbi:hypothetical protein VNO78_30567 [Psophocarpus tetragonolobus]|uniref:Uncharacterized protein n=1 Tax=Psophocarpus tetragonolobus TaxID=3891 RepID=A0AAN9RY50_PSOTE